MDNETLTFTLNAVDNVSPTAQRIADSQRQIADGAKQAQASLDSTRLSFLQQLAAATALRSGIQGVTGGLVQLEVVNEDMARSFSKVNAIAGMTVGTFQLYKGLQPVLAATRTALLSLAAVETYRSVLSSPWKLALVGAGLGAAGSIGGMMLTQNSTQQTNVQQDIVFQGAPQQDERSAAREFYAGMM